MFQTRSSSHFHRSASDDETECSERSFLTGGKANRIGLRDLKGYQITEFKHVLH